MTIALRVDNVSKQYRIYERPGDRLTESLSRGRLRRHREFWALRDINFEITAGTTVGIIGQNGCGKSTLLQIIAGTLAPTHGQIWHDGRIAALLELGAGFDPEFTGVENVYMNASLLGFSRRETTAIFPQIERFAEIGQFINQPVKTYSSGMYVRLAFAIAACVEPDILIIDEALAVGDAIFQHRCLRRIKELQERGSTVLFVSHDTAAVRALCDRAILLNQGRVIADGTPSEVLNDYQRIVMEREEAFEALQNETDQSSETNQISTQPVHYTYRHGDGSAEIIATELVDSSKRRIEIVETGAPLLARFSIRFNRDIEEPVAGFLIRNKHGIHAYGTNTKEQHIKLATVKAGESIGVNFAFDCWLGIDDYSISFAVHSSEGQAYDWLDGALFFRVISAVKTEGLANLHATATVVQEKSNAPRVETESLSYG
jgi:ABC-type polysaccharide/polyol phosphate transport system ATPase subunit